jgi:hypothetical protein
MVLTPRWITSTLAAVAGLLVLAALAGLISSYVFGHNHLRGLIPLFSVGVERSMPTAFSFLLLLLVSALLAVIGSGTRQRGDTGHRWWNALSAIFLFLALDELLSFHEKLNGPLHEARHLSGAFYFGWVIPYSILVILLGAFSIRFFLSLPAPTRRRMFLAAALFLGGAVGMEAVGGIVAMRAGTEKTLLYSVAVLIEESLEMAGTIVMIYALTKHIESALPDLKISFRS